MKSSLLQQAINIFLSRPALLFLIDGIGALLSATLLLVLHCFFLLTNGLPPTIVYTLIGVAFVLSAFSLTSGWLLKRHHSRYLRLLAILNGSYLLTVFIVIFYYFSRLELFLLLFFLLESLVISCLIYLECKVGNQLIRQEDLQ
jgi:hypothetical protein